MTLCNVCVLHSIGVFCLILAIYSLKQQLRNYHKRYISHTPITKAISQVNAVIIVFHINFFKLDWASQFLFHLPIQNIHLSRTSVNDEPCRGNIVQGMYITMKRNISNSITSFHFNFNKCIWNITLCSAKTIRLGTNNGFMRPKITC